MHKLTRLRHFKGTTQGDVIPLKMSYNRYFYSNNGLDIDLRGSSRVTRPMRPEGRRGCQMSSVRLSAVTTEQDNSFPDPFRRAGRIWFWTTITIWTTQRTNSIPVTTDIEFPSYLFYFRCMYPRRLRLSAFELWRRWTGNDGSQRMQHPSPPRHIAP